MDVAKNAIGEVSGELLFFDRSLGIVFFFKLAEIEEEREVESLVGIGFCFIKASRDCEREREGGSLVVRSIRRFWFCRGQHRLREELFFVRSANRLLVSPRLAEFEKGRASRIALETKMDRFCVYLGLQRLRKEGK